MITVLSVEFVDEECDVYDVEVEEDASFIVAGVVAHNSKICTALDGRRFTYADPKRKIPPFHPNCRTTCLPIPNWKTLGLPEPSPDDPRTAPLTFPSMDQWLREQPQFRQDAILGKTRGDWYRSGKLGLRELVDADDRVLTLEQLRTRMGAE